MIDLISRRALIKALDSVAMAHPGSQVQMAESDFRSLIKTVQRYDYRKPDAIVLSFATYCMDCQSCEAVVKTVGDRQVVCCSHQEECAHLVEVLEKKLTSDEADEENE